MNYDIKAIQVGFRKRGPNPTHVAQLAESIAQIGLLNPITITEASVLVAGYHRLEACRRLGWHDIPVTIRTLDALNAELAEIDENMMRHALTELEECVQLARRKEIYLALHPETQHGGDRKSEDGSNRHNGDLIGPAFTADTAARTGLARRTVERKTQIGEALAPLAPYLDGSDSETNQRDLLALALADTATREKAVAKIAVAPKLTARDALAEVRREERAVRPQATLPPTCTVDHADNFDNIADGSIDLVFVDPPYNISDAGKVTKVGDTVVVADFDGTDDWDTGTDAEYMVRFAGWAEGWSRVLRPGGAVVTFCDRILVTLVKNALEQHGLIFKNTIYWVKTNVAPNGAMRRNLHSSVEVMVWAVKPGQPYTFNQSDLWDGRNAIITPIISNVEKAGVDHPNQKPLSVLLPIIDKLSRPGDMVLDTHAGSGSTGVAALQLGRRAYLIEQDADYVRLARERVAALYPAHDTAA